MSEELKAVSYCVGMSIAGSLIQQNLGQISTPDFIAALDDVLQGREPKFSAEEANQIIQQFMQKAQEERFAENREKGEKFLADNFKKENVKTTLSGLQYEVLNEGNGDKPGPTSQVTVHYHGTLIDGTVFDSSVQRGAPATFGVNQVIPGWTEALQLMPKGSKYRLYIPQELAYGAHPHPGGPIEPYMALIFDVELLEIA